MTAGYTVPARHPPWPDVGWRGVPLDREPYFFLSHARRDDREDAFVGRFYEDLVAELDRLGADCGGQAPFRDVERMGLGTDWERTLGGRSAAARALVALCSPAYVNSLYCGKEWAAFQDRLVAYRQETDFDAPALIPVLWVPLRGGMPPEIGRYQYYEPAMGKEYPEQGLMSLMRTDPTGEAYRTVLHLVAKRCGTPPTSSGCPGPRTSTWPPCAAPSRAGRRPSPPSGSPGTSGCSSPPASRTPCPPADSGTSTTARPRSTGRRSARPRTPPPPTARSA